MGRELINNLKEENKKLLSIISMFKVNGLNLENFNDSISKDKVELNQFDYIIEKSALNYKNSNKELKITVKDMDIRIKEEKRKNIRYSELQAKIYKNERSKKRCEKKYEMLRQVKALRLCRSENFRCLIEAETEESNTLLDSVEIPIVK